MSCNDGGWYTWTTLTCYWCLCGRQWLPHMFSLILDGIRYPEGKLHLASQRNWSRVTTIMQDQRWNTGALTGKVTSLKISCFYDSFFQFSWNSTNFLFYVEIQCSILIQKRPKYKILISKLRRCSQSWGAMAKSGISLYKMKRNYLRKSRISASTSNFESTSWARKLIFFDRPLFPHAWALDLQE